MRTDGALLPVESGDPPAGRARPSASVGAVAVLCVMSVAVMWWLGRDDPRAATFYPSSGTSLADPFAVEWVALDGPGTDRAQPWPTVGVDRPCVGFSRIGWSDNQLQPTVAHCADEASLGEIPSDGVTVLKASMAGNDSWLFLRFGSEISSLDVEVDQAEGAVSLPAERIYTGGRYAAALLPNDNEGAELTWRTTTGARLVYRLS